MHEETTQPKITTTKPAVSQYVTTPHNTFDDNAPDEQTITALAAAVYIARAAYREALAMPDPAAALANIADNLDEVMPEIFENLGTTPDAAAVILPAVTDRVQAFTVVERARTTWDPEYRYVLDVLADGLKRGGDPSSVRADVDRLAQQFAASS